MLDELGFLLAEVFLRWSLLIKTDCSVPMQYRFIVSMRIIELVGNAKILLERFEYQATFLRILNCPLLHNFEQLNGIIMQRSPNNLARTIIEMAVMRSN